MAELYYDVRWSGDCDEKFIDDFNSVQDQVFKGAHDRELFKHQYIENIYGPSVLVVVYDGETPVAARGLWRNDIDGKEAYQPGRTCVLESCRGAGVFTKMTIKSVQLLPADALIYNFPNQYSFPGYMKMGWKLVHQRYLRFFILKSTYEKEHPSQMDLDYFNWWVKDKNKMKYHKRGNDFFLVKKMKPFCFLVVSKVDQSIASQCPKLEGLYVLFFESQKKTIYNKWFMPSCVVAKNSDVSYIPKWKIDAI